MPKNCYSKVYCSGWYCAWVYWYQDKFLGFVILIFKVFYFFKGMLVDSLLDVNLKSYTIMMWWLEIFPHFLSVSAES